VRGSNEDASHSHNPKLADPEGAAHYIDKQWAPEKVSQRSGHLSVPQASVKIGLGAAPVLRVSCISVRAKARDRMPGRYLFDCT
jgi:hypothetical protein